MTNTQLLILITVLILGYLYWKNQTALKPQPPEEEESEIFFDAPSDSEEETEELPVEKKDWFTEKHWLSDQEIDWALEQIIKELSPTQQTKHKLLESTQFMFAKEAMEIKDAEARDSFPVLLSELTGANEDLVFIPVNNPNFHWSLLVYQVKEKKFYHYDTLRGANDTYIKPLVTELLKFLLESWQDPQYHWEKYYNLKQGNTYDCGIAVIEIAKKVIQDYTKYERIFLYTRSDFNFAQARTEWRKKLEATHHD